MLGQFAKNLSILQSPSIAVCEQEVLVIGFHGLYIHIAHGTFTTNLISRIHLNECSENESFKVNFTQGYKLF